MNSVCDFTDYEKQLCNARLLEGIPQDHYSELFSCLHASVRHYEKESMIQRLGEPFLYSGIVLNGRVEGSFISENYNKININQFDPGMSFGEALACVRTTHSPVQLKALTDCTVLLLDLSLVLSDTPLDCAYAVRLNRNPIQILASQNVFSNLKLRIANQRLLRDRVLMYLYSLVPDRNGDLHIPFTQTAMAEFLGVNRSALSRKLGHMQDDGLIRMDGRKIRLLLK